MAGAIEPPVPTRGEEPAGAAVPPSVRRPLYAASSGDRLARIKEAVRHTGGSLPRHPPKSTNSPGTDSGCVPQVHRTEKQNPLFEGEVRESPPPSRGRARVGVNMPSRT